MSAIPVTNNPVDYLLYLIVNGLPAAASPMPALPNTQNPVDFLRYICQNGLTGGGGSVDPAAANTWTGAQGFTGPDYRNYTVAATSVLDVTKSALDRSLTADEQESFSATPTYSAAIQVRYTSDGTARTVTFNTTVYSQARQDDISASGFVVPAGATVTVGLIYSLIAARWEILGDPAILGIRQRIFSADTSLGLTDQDKDLIHPASDANDRTLTIPAFASIPFPLEAVIPITNLSANNVTVAITSDTLIDIPTGDTGSRTLPANSSATLRHVSNTTWLFLGVGTS